MASAFLVGLYSPSSPCFLDNNSRRIMPKWLRLTAVPDIRAPAAKACFPGTLRLRACLLDVNKYVVGFDLDPERLQVSGAATGRYPHHRRHILH